MKIILATSNKGKIKEIQNSFKNKDIAPYSDFIEPFEIEENGKTFQENAILKANAIFDAIDNKRNIVVLSDDSGISLPVLGNAPGIFSARYAGENATAKDNLFKLINDLKKRGIKKTPAFYTACIALVSQAGIFTVHGWMGGYVIDEARGDNGFGYDPMFVPLGYDKTLGELDENIKKELSHRSKALKRAKIILANMV
jgi:XTP/dITP diphosphohydrolase